MTHELKIPWIFVFAKFQSFRSSFGDKKIRQCFDILDVLRDHHIFNL